MSVAADQVLSYGPSARPRDRWLVLLGWSLGAVGLVAALILATYRGFESSALAMLVAAVVLAIVVVRPQVGILLLMLNFLVASYPSPIRGEGLLTINNLLGILLSVLLVAQLAQHPDFWFLRLRQVHVYLLLGLLFILTTVVAAYKFPELKVTGGRINNPLDQTMPMAQDFVTRLAFFVLTINFLTRKRDLKRAIAVMMISLVMIVPSALLGYVTGHAQAGYRAQAAFSAGTNPNRLAFLCVLQIAFWWYLIRARPTRWRLAAGSVVIASLIFTVFLTASRSGVLGLGVLLFLLTQRRGGVSTGRLQLMGVLLVVVAIVATVVPEENIERLQNLNPFAAGTTVVGSRSTEKRVETVELAGHMVTDHPIFGIGLGNFREVSRQIYLDPFWRPPHNSYVWAVTEGGIFCLVLYLMLFASTWRDIRWLQESPAVPPDLRWLAAALAPGFLMLLFFSAFADIWLTPITYIMIALPIVFRRYVSRRRVVVV